VTRPRCLDLQAQLAAEVERRTIGEASAVRWESEAKALRREIQHLRANCDTARIHREDKPSHTHG
jgi:hypothetical protein